MTSPELPSLRLDVVIPTYNRAGLLQKSVDSLLAARVPASLRRRILVVDNNSTDSTALVISRMSAAAPEVVVGLTERRQGRSAALNAGIRASGADLVGFIDDDETVSEGWYEAIVSRMEAPGIDFLGGPVLGSWEADAPPWLPRNLPAVIGVVDPGPVPLEFGPDFPGILMGGNCVIRRAVFERIGLYSTDLGRTDSGLLSGEDRELYARLLAGGFRGLYEPALRIFHHIPRERLTRRYYRSWCFWHGVSIGRRERLHREPVPHLAGIPRYHFGSALRGVAALVKGAAPARFAAELEFWNVAGHLYGRHLAGRTTR